MADDVARHRAADQVLALAPDAASQRAAWRLASADAWAETGSADQPGGRPGIVWGLARGSGRLPYQTAVDLAGPTSRCSCPSRKYPCKHALGLLLWWSAGEVPGGAAPGWVRAWQAERAARETNTATGGSVSAAVVSDAVVSGTAPGAGGRRPGERALAARRQQIAGGLADLDLWLLDQARAGIARLSAAGYEPWDSVAARLVDAKATALASTVRRLAAIAGDPDRLLTELGLLRLLIAGFRRIEDLPEDLAATVLARCGMPVSTEAVLSVRPPARDSWHVVGIREEREEQLRVRRVWLRGERTGRSALLLGFSGPRRSPGADPAADADLKTGSDLMPGTRVEADLCFYPGAQPLRALIAHRHRAPLPGAAPSGTAIDTALDQHAAALARDPWLERWPMVLAEVVPVAGDAAGQWFVAERQGSALPLDLTGTDPWRLVGAAGGSPTTIAAEWSAAGLRPLTAWPDNRVVPL
ncbi:MAG: SWIM zinc finger family protein [Dactylosporangium sp.]|nr:SWIM zinc finger domain-containing protein [Dactylosporangium sp.]NNJ61098.1 SWIM zinc finger family protein [Dactylosporangium sp.]